MKRYSKGDILFSRTVTGPTLVYFYQVIRATSSTCEVREIRKEIKTQLHDEQEVIPIKDAFVSRPMRRKTMLSGCLKIDENVHAWPWDGKSQWQTAIIFV